MTDTKSGYWVSNGMAKVIALCQLIFATIGIISLACEISVEISTLGGYVDEMDTGDYQGEHCDSTCCQSLEEIEFAVENRISDFRPSSKEVIQLLVLLLGLEAISIISTFALLYGFHHRMLNFIKIWITLALGYVTLWTVFFIFLQNLRSWDGGIAMNTRTLVSTWAIQGFSIWIFILLQIEMDEDIVNVPPIQMKVTP